AAAGSLNTPLPPSVWTSRPVEIIQCLLCNMALILPPCGTDVNRPGRSEGALVERVEVRVDGLAVGLEPSPAAIARAEAGERLGREVRARLTFHDQLADPLSDQERAGDPEGVAPGGREQPADGRHLADQEVPVGREGRKARASPDDRCRLEGGKGARESSAKLLQDSLVPFGLLDRESGGEVGHGEPLGGALEIGRARVGKEVGVRGWGSV